MKPFTVILMYPDYATEEYGETWCATVMARNPVEAVEKAQETCASDTNESVEPENACDFKPVSVFAGDHQDLVGVWAEAMNTRS